MQQTRFRVWLQLGVKELPPNWKHAKAIVKNRFDPNGFDVVVEGNGADFEEYLKSNKLFFIDWVREPD